LTVIVPVPVAIGRSGYSIPVLRLCNSICISGCIVGPAPWPVTSVIRIEAVPVVGSVLRIEIPVYITPLVIPIEAAVIISKTPVVIIGKRLPVAIITRTSVGPVVTSIVPGGNASSVTVYIVVGIIVIDNGYVVVLTV
jgi:hypothetical protein